MLPSAPGGDINTGMSVIYLIRHGQASFGQGNYDCLSELGRRQSGITGDALRSLGLRFDAAYCGTMARQQDTARAVLDRLEAPPSLEVAAEFNEYESGPAIKALLPAMIEENSALAQAVPKMFSDRRSFQLVYEGAMARWISGRYDIGEAESWPTFLRRVEAAVDRVRGEAGRGKNVLVFSSGGPISAVTRQALGLQDETTLRLTWMIKNASISTFFYNQRGLALSMFNSTVHLEQTGDPGLITYR
ncbi:MAG: histidine phosphatase family protein [Desulfarculus sp.]|jgi:broad specificity phosphatase PhoE|nr:MAG: histidine phosphatase family protein [Desulfarculus sp.]